MELSPQILDDPGRIWVLIGGLPGAPTRGKQKKVKKTLNYILK